MSQTDFQKMDSDSKTIIISINYIIQNLPDLKIDLIRLNDSEKQKISKWLADFCLDMDSLRKK